MDFFISLLAVILLVAPLAIIYRRKTQGKATVGSIYLQIGAFFAFFALSSVYGMSTTAFAAETAAAGGNDLGLGLIAAALSIGLAGIGSGIGIAASAAAAIGAVSENDKMFGKALIFVALAESISLFGLLIAFQILGRL